MKVFTMKGALLGGGLLLLVVLGAWLALHKPKTDVQSPTETPEVVVLQSGVPVEASFVGDLTQGHVKADWYIAEYASSGHYNTGWARDHLVFSDTELSLVIDRQPTANQPHTGGEYQRIGHHGYGRYEVVMRPAKGSGLVSSFFTFTGPPFGHPHDEIDFEFLGNDTSKVQLNIHVNGVALNPPLVELGFDASEDFNLYAFEWTEDKIDWYANDKLIFTVSGTETDLPAYPGKIMINLWTGKEQTHQWHGRPEFADGSKAEYKCISFRSNGDKTKQCSDDFQ